VDARWSSSTRHLTTHIDLVVVADLTHATTTNSAVVVVVVVVVAGENVMSSSRLCDGRNSLLMSQQLSVC